MNKTPTIPRNKSTSKFLGLFQHLTLSQTAGLLGLGALSLVLVGWGWWSITERTKIYRLTLAAGAVEGESYILSKAIEQVVEKYQPNIQIEVKETGGTSENLKLLDANEAQLVTAQSDVPASSSATVVTNLYQDIFQLVVQGKSNIKQFSDFRGKKLRIGLPSKGGQFRSFIEIANHYGLQISDFNFVGSNEREADDAFRQGQAEVVFRVRALGNKYISELIQTYQGRLLPIDQAAAMKIKYPAFQPAVIPRGAYRGNPAMPIVDLPTVAVQRVLLAHRDTDKDLIQLVTSIIDSNRQEIAAAIPDRHKEVRPLVDSISRPNLLGSNRVPIHPGAQAYYDRDKPSFIQENADYVALILTVILLVSSWVLQMKSLVAGKRKDAADEYIKVSLELMNDDRGSIEEVQLDLEKIFRRAATDLIREKISQESFRTFNEAYKTTRESIERKRLQTERLQKERADELIKQIFALMQAKSGDIKNRLAKLDLILESAAAGLVSNHISQESFRTFIEAYKTARDAIGRKLEFEEADKVPSTSSKP